MTRHLTPLQLAHQNSPANPAAGTTSVFARTGDRLYYRTATGVERQVEPGILFVFSRAGTLAVSVGTFRLYNDTGETLTLKAVRTSVGVAPAGASVLVDINVDGATVFSTQSNRPAIAAGNFTSGAVRTMNTISIADGSYFTVDVDAIGTTVAGSDLTVQILC
ncbi:hypothetical protein AB0B89_36335 [Sphaerisporangium sp. NPDC049002]|uniref:hypothetical protein n=1 Tax=Sphaerisporangium sp. NPDC049002 TaxID=3155392 RepID=UPI0033C11EB9